jgi:CheY-like chemotaxis protein
VNKRIVYFHWHEKEAVANLSKIKLKGYTSELGVLYSQADFKAIRDNPPELFIIDLSRLPSHGREVAVGLRSYKSTRQIPIVFVGGEEEKINKVKQVLPDALFCGWKNLISAIKQAEQLDGTTLIQMKNSLQAYSNTPLPQKLGIKENILVGLIDPPKNLKQTIGDLPDGVKLVKNPKQKSDLFLLFALFMGGLENNFEVMNHNLNDRGSVWIFWPKKTSGIESDLNQQEVRNYGLARGFVDYKVCSFDETWSGLKFCRRKKQNE